MNVPLMDLNRSHEPIAAELNAAINGIVSSCQFIGGEPKLNFEANFAKACGTKFCQGVGNGTDALSLIFQGLGLGQGDEVVVPALSFIASSETVTTSGAKVRFVDIDPETYNIDLSLLESLLEKQAHTKGGSIKAIVAVHLYGRLIDMKSLMDLANKYQVYVVEDCAQTHLAEQDGQKAGSFGVAGSFSFYPGKNLGAFGDGGAIVTNDEALFQRIKMLSNHGRLSKYDHEFEGYNSRLDTLQAAVLDVKLKHLPKWTQLRQEKALVYDELLKDVAVNRPMLPEQGGHVFHLYVIQVKEGRDQLLQRMKEKGIGVGVHYPIALPNLKAYGYLGHRPEDFPVATTCSNQILSLPMFPEITHQEQTEVVAALRQSLSEL